MAHYCADISALWSMDRNLFLNSASTLGFLTGWLSAIGIDGVKRDYSLWPEGAEDLRWPKDRRFRRLI